MNLKNSPQPIPYQGSKRAQVPVILRYLPKDTDTLYEPFVGSGAVTIGAALASVGKRFVVGDTLEPLVGIWSLILNDPERLAGQHEAIWTAQLPDSRNHFDLVRDQFNKERLPSQLLYLIARCVKNAIRFNSDGNFNQSPDKRRLGMKPSLLRQRLSEVNAILAGRSDAVCADYSSSLSVAGADDVVYMDPPYMGVSGGRDSRYHQGLDYPRFVQQLALANSRDVSFLVSFDGRCGEKVYGPGLPESLGLERIEVHAGRSSQATLNGRTDETFESLYLSPALVRRLRAQDVGVRTSESVKRPPDQRQLSIGFVSAESLLLRA